MMKTLTKTSKTVDEAIAEALQELNLSKDQVAIEILEEPSKGFFGLGSKEARVKVTQIDDAEDKAKAFLQKILAQFKIQADVVIRREEDLLKINILGQDSDEMGVLIGKRGKTLDALQYLVSLVVNAKRENFLKIILDTEDYRVRREEILKDLAHKMAERAVKRGRSVRLDPMNPYERRIIHATLQTDDRIETYSIGEEPYRRIIIQVK